MKKALVFVVVFLLGFISGVLYHHWTGGATDRASAVMLVREFVDIETAKTQRTAAL